MNLYSFLLIAFGFLLSIEQGFTVVLGVLSSGVARGADVLMPVDVAIYALFLMKPGKRIPKKYKGLYIFATAFGLIYLAWSFSGEFVAVERADFRFGFVHLIRAILVYLCILNRVSTRKDVIDFTMGVVFGLGFEAAIGVWQWQIGPVFIPFFHVINDWRATGTLGVGNAFGCFIALLAPLSIRMAMFTSIKPKWLWYTISILSLGSLLASYTRGAWFAFTGSMIIFFYLDFLKRKLNRKQTVWLFVVLIAGITFTSVKYGHVITGRMSDSKESLVGHRKHSRMGLAKDAMRIIKENPITGVGLNNYRYHADRETQGTRIVHNAYLLIAAQQGYPGIAIFLILNLVIFIYGFKLRKSRDPALYHIGMAALTGTLALFIYHLVAPDYRLVIPKLHHWRAIAFIVALLIADERTRIIYRRRKTNKNRKTNGVSKSQMTIHNQHNETALQKY